MEYTLEKFEKEVDLQSYIEGYVDIEQFLECCKACPNFGKVWSCPPYDFHPMEIWGAYSRILVYGYRIAYKWDEDDIDPELDAKLVFNKRSRQMTKVLADVKARVSEELFQKEAEIPGSLSLSAGSCHLCESCAKQECQPCRFKDKMRYSIESLGGNVGKTLSDLCGFELEWVEEGRLPEHFVLCGALLTK